MKHLVFGGKGIANENGLYDSEYTTYKVTENLENSIICNYGGYGTLNVDDDYCDYYNNGSNYMGGSHTNEITINPTTNGLNYLCRIESGSTLKTAGSGGTYVGANITKKIGVEGTYYGQTGYDTVTANNLWPFPNEDIWGAKMRQYSNFGGNGSRGFCADGQTLTKYIWEYLGNTIPAEIYAGSSDDTAPTAVSNLSVTGTTTSTASLSWTSPGDDGASGTAASYDIRYNTQTITESNWGTSTQIGAEPTPSSAGTVQTMTVSGLSAATTYYFAMKASDEVPNVSALSNVANGTTAAPAVDNTAPYTTGHSPTKNMINVAPGTNIVVHVKDDGAGVDINTIVMRVNSQVVSPAITGTPADYTLTYDPPSDFNYGASVSVEVQASDLAP